MRVRALPGPRKRGSFAPPKEWGEEPEDENDTSVGIRRYGLMDAGYTSTGRGCNPDYEARRALQQRFLCGGVLED